MLTKEIDELEVNIQPISGKLKIMGSNLESKNQKKSQKTLRPYL